MIKAVVFDLDGTLIDSADDLCAALNRLLAEERLRPLSRGRGRADDRRRGGKLVERAIAAAGGKADALCPSSPVASSPTTSRTRRMRRALFRASAEALETLTAQGMASASAPTSRSRRRERSSAPSTSSTISTP